MTEGAGKHKQANLITDPFHRVPVERDTARRVESLTTGLRPTRTGAIGVPARWRALEHLERGASRRRERGEGKDGGGRERGRGKFDGLSYFYSRFATAGEESERQVRRQRRREEEGVERGREGAGGEKGWRWEESRGLSVSCIHGQSSHTLRGLQHFPRLAPASRQRDVLVFVFAASVFCYIKSITDTL